MPRPYFFLREEEQEEEDEEGTVKVTTYLPWTQMRLAVRKG